MKRRLILFLLLVLLAGLSAPARAAAGGETLPFNEPITKVVDNLTGPTANAVIVVIFFAGLVSIGIGRDQPWVKTLGGALVIVALLAKTPSLPGILGVGTATAADPASPLAALALASGLFAVVTAPLLLMRERRSPRSDARV